MEKFSHINESGKAKMVDVGNKTNQLRIAKAKGNIKLNKKTIALIRDNNMKMIKLLLDNGAKLDFKKLKQDNHKLYRELLIKPRMGIMYDLLYI